MRFSNEDGLIFNCKPLEQCTFDKHTYVAVIQLDDEPYAVFSNEDRMNCIRGARNFTAKYKLRIKVYEVVIESEDNTKFIEQFKYNYDDHLRYLKNRKPFERMK